ncbi:hypothetical protein OnM2_c2231o41 [Erysiphe neolycopersici]|uniref:Uncharacterized protein n=1 Tax=Erysiphe neolycopersici TaxID=212602 RepID=A0A420I0S4_9PEZI|nr:hypothetical protein OnM2_c2231o41 [Erysiphe neolycopersici]
MQAGLPIHHQNLHFVFLSFFFETYCIQAATAAAAAASVSELFLSGLGIE